MSRVRITADLTHDEVHLKHLKQHFDSFLRDLVGIGFRTADSRVLTGFEPASTETGTVTAVSNEQPEVDGEPAIDLGDDPSNEEVKAAIERLTELTGDNRVLSQKEMAETLGVSRYRVRKALGKV